MRRILKKSHLGFRVVSIIFISLILCSRFSGISVYATNGSDVTVDPVSPSYTVSSGEFLLEEIEIRNNGSLPINFQVSYMSNLLLDEHTMGLWNFNEGNGTIVRDETGNNNGSLSGASWVTGKFGGALNFDGVNDFVIVPNSEDLEADSISIETWIKLDTANQWTPIGGIKYESYGLYYREDGLFRTHIWGLEQGLKWYDSAKYLELDTWYYVVMTYDSETGELALYLDGVKIESRFEGGDVVFQSPTNLVFGRAWTETMWDLLDGSIDEIRISNIARDKIEIAENYRRALTGDNEWLRFNETSGQLLPNSTHNLEILLDASGLKPGIYQREISLVTDDEIEPYRIIPITLEVLPVLHDIAIQSAIIPETYLAGIPTPIMVEISNFGTFDETDFLTLLYIDGELVDSSTTLLLSTGESITQQFHWTASRSGLYHITLYAAPFSVDEVKSNNVFSTPISILGQPDLWLNTSSLEIQLSPGQIGEKNFILGNNGTDDLAYHFIDTYSDTIFFDDMEIGENGWTHEGSYDSWEYGEPFFGPRKAFSGQYLWGTSLSSNYGDSSNCSLVSPLINLNNRINPVLSINHWYSIEKYHDFGYIEVWDESKWVKITPSGFTGESRSWLHEEYDLSQFIDKIIQIRFRLEADDEIIKKGWFIDDVLIIDLAGAQSDYVTEYPQSGSILPTSQDTITVTVYASILQIGEYQEFITIRSNDPDDGLITIPFRILIVSGENGSIPGNGNGQQGTDYKIEVNEDEVIIIDGSQYVKISDILDFTWTFEDDGLQVLKGVSPTYVFETPGAYQVTLVVTDFSGNQASVNLTVTVRDITAPTLDDVSDISANEDEPVMLDGSRSYDNVGVSNFTWAFEDDGLQVLKGVSPTYVFETPGAYQVTLVVTDFSGNQASVNLTVTVRDITAPTANAGEDQTASIENVITFTGIGSTDNIEIRSYEWDFSDGSTGEGDIITHSFSSIGVYNVSLTTRDKEGNSDIDWVLVTIQPASPVFNLGIIAIGFILIVIFVVFRQRFFPKRPSTKRLVYELKEK